MTDAHPALVAVSPQAPVTDYYLGDDSFHNGAFMLAANFGFYTAFKARPGPPAPPGPRAPFDFGTPDGYEFYLGLGPLWSGAERHGLNSNPHWRINLEHTTYDEFWKARSIWRHFKHITPALLTVGGWFHAQDLIGPLSTYITLHSIVLDAEVERESRRGNACDLLGDQLHSEADGDSIRQWTCIRRRYGNERW